MSGARMNDIKARIKSVKGTMQITKAMELVATSKLRRAKEAAEGSRPYLNLLFDAIKKIGAFGETSGSPYSERNREGDTLIITIAGDRGLAGGYNANVFKLASALDENRDAVYLPIGKKAHDLFVRRGYRLYFPDMITTDGLDYDACAAIASDIVRDFLSGVLREVKIVYTDFVSLLTLSPTEKTLLPLEDDDKDRTAPDPIFEGDPEELLAKIVPMYIGGVIYSALASSVASECAARRTAMNSANKNAEEMIDSLMLEFNRARQAVITQEITEIVSGAEAL